MVTPDHNADGTRRAEEATGRITQQPSITYIYSEDQLAGAERRLNAAFDNLFNAVFEAPDQVISSQPGRGVTCFRTRVKI
jgi:hypothetical protein